MVPPERTTALPTGFNSVPFQTSIELTVSLVPFSAVTGRLIFLLEGHDSDRVPGMCIPSQRSSTRPSRLFGSLNSQVGVCYPFHFSLNKNRVHSELNGCRFLSLPSLKECDVCLLGEWTGGLQGYEGFAVFSISYSHFLRLWFRSPIRLKADWL